MKRRGFLQGVFTNDWIYAFPAAELIFDDEINKGFDLPSSVRSNLQFYPLHYCWFAQQNGLMGGKFHALFLIFSRTIV
jgi:hypothetical protein